MGKLDAANLKGFLANAGFEAHVRREVGPQVFFGFEEKSDDRFFLHVLLSCAGKGRGDSGPIIPT
jgi:hypothetical protein